MDFKLFRLFFLVVACATRASSQLFGQDDGIGKTLAVCGGTIESDSDKITYSVLNQGEVCIWVIHLQTRMGFRFNFSEFDVSSDFTDCRDGGIRIYALTNLAPPDESQSYAYCNNHPPPQEFFLGYSIAVVILHVGSENSSPGSGFELNWSGSSVDPLRTKHISSYSTAPEGLIKYPVVGAYPTSVAATWLVKPLSAQRPISVDLSISQIGLEECSLEGGEDPCACDSLILYQIGTAGYLNETRRMCEDEAGIDFYNLENRFLLALFTDLEDLAGGDGFMAMYYPSQDITTTVWQTTTLSTTITTEQTTTDEPTTTTERTTTEEPTTTTERTTTEEPTTTSERTTTEEPTTTTQRTTTEEPTTTSERTTTEEPTTTTERTTTTTTTTTEEPTTVEPDSICGDVLLSVDYWRYIMYKRETFHDPNERCTWTINNRRHTTITFEHLGYISASGVNVYINTFTNRGVPLLTNDKINSSANEYSKTVLGSLAVVTFATDAQSNFGGLYLRFRSGGQPPNNISLSSVDRPFAINGSASIRHPWGPEVYYSYEFSSILVNKYHRMYDGEYLEYYFHEYASGSMRDDFADVYSFSYQDGWNYDSRLSTYHIFQRRDMVLVLFISNNVYEGTGFQLRINAPGTFTTPEVNTTTERTTTPEETTTTEQATTAEPTTTTERTTTEEPTTMYELPTTPGTESRCGEILGSSTAWKYIYYRHTAPHDPHDRCTWTIDNRQHSTITFENLQDLPSDVYVFINTFTKQEYPLLVNDRIYSSTGNYSKTFPGSLAIVTVATGPQSNLGGIFLRYRSGGPAQNISSFSRDITRSGIMWPEGIRYPANTGDYPNNYTNNEFSSILINNKYTGNLDYEYREYSPGSMFDDFVEAYTFSYQNGWTYYQRFTRDTQLFILNELVLFLFVSNDVSTGRGLVIYIDPSIYTTTEAPIMSRK